MDYTVQQQTDAVMWWDDLPRWKKPGLIEKHFPVSEIVCGIGFALLTYQICEIYEKEITNKIKSEVKEAARELGIDLKDIGGYERAVIWSKFDWKSRLN